MKHEKGEHVSMNLFPFPQPNAAVGALMKSIYCERLALAMAWYLKRSTHAFVTDLSVDDRQFVRSLAEHVALLLEERR